MVRLYVALINSNILFIKYTMTWNPLKKNNLTCRPSSAPPAISRSNDLELEQVFIRLQTSEEATRRLQKEIKKYLDSISAAGKAEQKITTELSASLLCHQNAQLRQVVEDYHTVTSQVCDGVQQLLRILQQTFQEPLKIYKGQFGNIDATFHHREMLVQEWKNIYGRVKKLEEKDKTAGNLVKLAKERQALELSSEELANFHNSILAELLQFLSKRGDYFLPTLQALVRSQLDFHGNTTRLFTRLLPTSSKIEGTPTSSHIPEDEYQESIQSKLAKIRALSIVKQS